MRTSVKVLAGLALGVVGPASQAAIVVSLSALGDVTTSVAGALVDNFDDGVCVGGFYSSCSGSYAVLSGTSGTAAQPAGSTGMYLTVPTAIPGSATLTLNTAATYFGLLWGSVDDYNAIAFYSNGLKVEDYTGTDIVGATYDNGDRVSLNSNRYINFLFTGGQSFDQIVFSSVNFAFESDNHAITPVPLPAAAWLLLSGLTGLGVLGRRRVAATASRRTDSQTS